MSKQNLQYSQYLKSYDDIDLNTLNKEIFNICNDLYDLDIDLIIESINNIDKKLKKQEQEIVEILKIMGLEK